MMIISIVASIGVAILLLLALIAYYIYRQRNQHYIDLP